MAAAFPCSMIPYFGLTFKYFFGLIIFQCLLQLQLGAQQCDRLGFSNGWMLGLLVKKVKGVKGNVGISVTELPSGIYFLSIVDDKGEHHFEKGIGG